MLGGGPFGGGGADVGGGSEDCGCSLLRGGGPSCGGGCVVGSASEDCGRSLLHGGGPSGGGGCVVGAASEDCGRSLLLGGSPEARQPLAPAGPEECAVVVGAGGGVAFANKLGSSGCGVAFSSVVPVRLLIAARKRSIVVFSPAEMLCATLKKELELAAVDDVRATGRDPGDSGNDVRATGRDPGDSGISWRYGSGNAERNPKRLSIKFWTLAL